MTKVFENGRVLGLIGILAALVYVVTLFATAFTTPDFAFGVNNIKELGGQTIYMAGCIIAGIFGLSCGSLIAGSKGVTLIFRIYGILFMAASLVLVIASIMKFDGIIVWVFLGLACATIAAHVADAWVSDQKVMMIISLFFLILVAVTGAMDIIMGFAFALLLAVWVFMVFFIQYSEARAPAVAAKPEPKKAEPKKPEPKKAAPAKAAPAKAAPAKKDKKKKPEPKKAEPPKPEAKPEPAKAEAKKEEPVKAEPPKAEPKKEEPKKAEPKKEEPVAAKKEEIPKLKVMSSKEAAAARGTAAEKKAETVKEEPVKAELPKPEVKPEPVKEPAKEEPVKFETVEPEPIEESDVPDDDIDAGGEDFDIVEDTPDALVRRAAWNKGLRCRRNYGEHNIPVAFVKGKVAVYILPEKGDESVDDKLRAEGWTVFRYLESQITDGKDQGEEIAKAVKENIKTERAGKKKKAKK